MLECKLIDNQRCPVKIFGIADDKVGSYDSFCSACLYNEYKKEGRSDDDYVDFVSVNIQPERLSEKTSKEDAIV